MPIPTPLLQTLTQALSPAEHQTLEKELKQIGTRIANLLDGYITAPAPSIEHDPEQWVQPLSAAIEHNNAAPADATKQRIELLYHSAGRNQTTRRIVQPYWLEEQHTYKYLRAYCESTDEVRLFRLDRILSCVTQ